MGTVRGKPKGYFNKILVADCETTGLCMGTMEPYIHPTKGIRHQAVSWGMIIADANTLQPIEELYVEIKWNEFSKEQKLHDPTFGKRAEEIHGLTPDYLEKKGVDEEQAVAQIGDLILKHFGDSSIRLMGHNVSTFDRYFLWELFFRYGINLNFGHRCIDTNTLGFVCYGTYNSDDLFELLGIIREDHNALEDAGAALLVAQTTRDLFNRFLDSE